MSEPPPSASVRVRFAPSPTGFLHLGSARTALFNWLTARHASGEMLLRIEDTDADRSAPEHVEVIFRTLEWLGIDWDGVPVLQSERADLYRDAADKLLASGDAYYCDCAPDDVKARVEARGGKRGYDSHCRERGLGPAPDRVVRFRTPRDGETSFADVIRGDVVFHNADLEDFVIVRANGNAMFLVANAVDDVEQAVTHVLRGEDLLNVTPKVLLLRHALGHRDDPVFAHLPLIVNEKRQKLSKRRDDVAVESYRDRGFLPEAMANYLATLGWGPPDGVEIRPMAEIVSLFALDEVNKASAFFDVKKLEHFNGEYIRALPVGDFVDRSAPWLAASHAPWTADDFDAAVFAAMAPLVQERVKVLAEVPGYVDFLFVDDAAVLALDDPPKQGEDEAPGPVDPRARRSWAKVMGKDPQTAVTMLDGTIDAFAACEWTVPGIEEALFGFGERNGIAKKKAQAPVRVAVMGRTVGPPLLESLEVLGRERTIDRLRAARALL